MLFVSYEIFYMDKTEAFGAEKWDYSYTTVT